MHGLEVVHLIVLATFGCLSKDFDYNFWTIENQISMVNNHKNYFMCFPVMSYIEQVTIDSCNRQLFLRLVIMDDLEASNESNFD